MQADSNINSDTVCIIEKDTNNDVMLTWVYPGVDDDVEKVLMSRSNLAKDSIPLQFTYSRFRSAWIYIYTQVVEKEAAKGNLTRVQVFSICLLRNVFNPEKYRELSKQMAHVYSTSADPSQVLACQLKVLMTGTFNGGSLGKFIDSDYDNRRAYLASPLTDLIQTFAEDVIILWTALLCKKRVFVYSSDLSLLQKSIRAMPMLVWHRQNWNVLRPFMTLSDLEKADLKTAGVYVAGTNDDSIKSEERLWDVLVDLDDRSISVASHAKDEMAMNNFHKDLSEFLVNIASSSENDQAVIKQTAVKTRDLLTKLDNFREEDESDQQSYVSPARLQKLGPVFARFLFNVASAEGMTK